MMNDDSCNEMIDDTEKNFSLSCWDSAFFKKRSEEGKTKQTTTRHKTLTS